MKSLTIFGMIACVGLLFTTAAVNGKDIPNPLDVNVSTVYRFAGYTASNVTPGNGINAMNRACQDEYAEDYRMCTTDEFLKSPKYNAPETQGWIQPAYMTALIIDDELIYIGKWGTTYSQSTGKGSCRLWGSNDESKIGLITEHVDGDTFNPSACNADRPVTCCQPVTGGGGS